MLGAMAWATTTPTAATKTMAVLAVWAAEKVAATPIQADPQVAQARAATRTEAASARSDLQLMPRNYRSEYDNYHAKPKQKKNRAKRNAAGYHGEGRQGIQG